MKTIGEQIRDLEATRAAKAARLDAIMRKAMDEGRSTDEAESQEFDTTTAEIDKLDADLNRLKTMQRIAAGTARPVDGTGNGEGTERRGAASRAVGQIIHIASGDKDERFKGQNFTRQVIAKAAAALQGCLPSQIAENRWGKTNPTLVALIKAGEVAGGGTLSGDWGAELVQADTRYTGDFINFLYSMTVFDKLGLREIPANVMVKGQDGQATANWVGQGKAAKTTVLDFSDVELSSLEVVALAVISNRLILEADPSAEALVQDGLVQASSQRVDQTFLSATAASAGVSPAGILQGLSAISSAGTDDVALRQDVAALYAPFLAAKNASNLSFVMNKGLAKAIQLIVTALGIPAFPGITQDGGTLLGDPVVTGDNVGATDLILLKPSDIYRIGDRGVQVALSGQATIEQNTTPTGDSITPTAASATMVNMFQARSTAIMVSRIINFAKRRASAVAYVGDAAYGTPTSP